MSLLEDQIHYGGDPPVGRYSMVYKDFFTNNIERMKNQNLEVFFFFFIHNFQFCFSGIRIRLSNLMKGVIITHM